MPLLCLRRLYMLPLFIFLFTLYYFYNAPSATSRFRKSHPPQQQRPIGDDSVQQTPIVTATAAPVAAAGPHLTPGSPKYPVSSFMPLPTGKAKKIPTIQFDFPEESLTTKESITNHERQLAVKDAFLHAWNGYKKFAWAKDEVSPVAGFARDSFGGWGATLVDSMDTLWLMGLKEEFDACVEAVEKVDFTTSTEEILNVFETTIRYLGGLLGAYEISDKQYPNLLKKAKELGDILYMAFDTPTHMPLARWEWRQAAAGKEVALPEKTLIAELGSLSLEFTRLSQLTHEPKYFDAIQRITGHLKEAQGTTHVPGLWPTIIDLRTWNFSMNHFTFGALADSAYEYLPKEHLLLGGLDPDYQTMYETAIETAKKHIFFRPLTPDGADILFAGSTGLDDNGKIQTEPQAQHLACFTGGMLGTAAKIFKRPDDLKIARKLVDGCVWAYNSTTTGLMPELFYLTMCHSGVEVTTEDGVNPCAWSDKRWYEAVAARHWLDEDTRELDTEHRAKFWEHKKSLVKPYTDIPDPRYVLRPEAIESLFILYRITGDATLLENAWLMFLSVIRATRTDIAHSGIHDVMKDRPTKNDRMESFWLAETLKYFYLIFGNTNVLSLDEWVLNTEAHPFRRPRAGDLVG